MITMENKSEKSKKELEQEQNDRDAQKNKEALKIDDTGMGGNKKNIGNDISSEIKIANAEGELEGGDNKQWHMDQGNFEEHEKKDFENSDDKNQ